MGLPAAVWLLTVSFGLLFIGLLVRVCVCVLTYYHSLPLSPHSWAVCGHFVLVSGLAEKQSVAFFSVPYL